MQEILRTLRIITFIGLSYIFLYVSKGVHISTIIGSLKVQSSYKDYFYCFNIICLCSYPILLLITIIYLWIHFGGVKLIKSTTIKVGLLQLFIQNELLLPGNIISDWQYEIFQHNDNWFGASFLGMNDSWFLIKILRRIIASISYILFIPVMHILFITIFILVYYGIGLLFIH